MTAWSFSFLLSDFSFIMLLTTTPTIEGRPVQQYLGIVTAETIFGANFFRDLFAQVRDIIGGRSRSYEEVLQKAKDEALRELSERAEAMGANAVVGVDFSYEAIGQSGSMLMLVCTGTAVKI